MICFLTILLLLGGELLAERCRTGDLVPSIPVLRLPPCRVDPKVLGLNVLINRSQPGGSWTTNRQQDNSVTDKSYLVNFRRLLFHFYSRAKVCENAAWRRIAELWSL